MKRFVCFLSLFVLLFGLVSCDSERSSYSILTAFLSDYGTRGRVYSFSLPEGDDGRMTAELYYKLYPEATELPSDFAVMLNTHPDFGAECGIFICRSADERASVTELSISRLRLLDPTGDYRLLVRSGNAVFYSTLRDRSLAERLIYSLIG